MKNNARFHINPGRFCMIYEPLQALSRSWPMMRAHAHPRCPNNSLSDQPKVGQCRQRRRLSGFFCQSLGETELALDESKRVFRRGTHAGRHLLSPVQQANHWGILIHRPALGRTYCHMPVHFDRPRPIGCTLVTRIGQDDWFPTLPTTVFLGDIVEVGCAAKDGVKQTAIRIHSDAPLHYEAP